MPCSDFYWLKAIRGFTFWLYSFTIAIAVSLWRSESQQGVCRSPNCSSGAPNSEMGGPDVATSDGKSAVLRKRRICVYCILTKRQKSPMCSFDCRRKWPRMCKFDDRAPEDGFWDVLMPDLTRFLSKIKTELGGSGTYDVLRTGYWGLQRSKAGHFRYFLIFQ